MPDAPNAHADDPLAPLEADIGGLEAALHDAVRELCGDRALALIDRLERAAAKVRAARGDDARRARDAFAADVAALDIDQLAVVARAFTEWFHLVNAAEEQHRIRVLRDRDTGPAAGSPTPESVAAAVAELAAAGLSAADVQSLLDRLFVMPVLTAHPTEARRRTVLGHLERISRALDTLDRTRLGAGERADITEELRRAVLALLATEESRAAKPTPHDEVAAGLAVFETTLLDTTPRVYRALESALRACYPGADLRVPAFLRWGSWIGGDRDGNPYVTADVTRSVLDQSRRAILGRYLRDVDALAAELSASSRRVGGGAARADDGASADDASASDVAPPGAACAAGLAELGARLARDRDAYPERAARLARYHTREPWREALAYARLRLEATCARGDGAYTDADAYLEDLDLLDRSLRACGLGTLADGALRDARRRVQIFGFHLASLDLRQHSAVHERATDDVLACAGLAPRGAYLADDEPARQARLTALLARPGLPAPPLRDVGPETREILTTLDMVGRARREMGPRACERYVVSFTSAPSDLLEVLLLVRAAGLAPGELRPVPLLEQLEDLDRAGAIADAMLDSAPVRAAIGDELEVMIGYSDAGKQIGYFAAAVALRRAQLALADVAERRGVTLTIFHGRGGAIGRGGGPANRTIRAQPPRALRGRIRITEQGETVTARYRRPEIAERDLEQMIHAVLVAARAERAGPSGDDEASRAALFDHAAARARAVYDDLVSDRDQLAAYAVAATPILPVMRLPIGSRPASRRAEPGGPALSFDDLRAIPWVFSWNQSRHGLPGWYGLGTAIEAIVERVGAEQAVALFHGSPFFRAQVENAQLALARADIDVAEHYARLAPPSTRAVFERIQGEHARTVAGVLSVVTGDSVLSSHPHLLGTVQRRNPYVDILSHAQIELLSRLRAATEPAERERISSVLFITINGIAAGLQTAG